MKIPFYYRWLLLSLCLLLWQCSGGSSGAGGADDVIAGDVTGLEIADQIDLVTTNESADGTGFAAAQPADSDYFADAALVRTHVQDDAMQSMSMVNEIVCMMSQTLAAELVNTDPYIALIDIQKCEKGGQQESGSSTSTPELEKWIVQSLRPDAKSPQLVSVWIEPDDVDYEDGFSSIRAKVSITVEADDKNLFGDFSLLASMLDASDKHVGGVLLDSKLGEDGFNHVTMNMDQGPMGMLLNAKLDAKGNGQAIMRVSDFWHDMDGGGNQIQTQTIRTASNSDYFAASFENGDLKCKAKADPLMNVWRYNLYSADSGDRLEINGGFHIQAFSVTDSHPIHGFAGYYGIWLPADIALAGLKVENDAGDEFTVFEGDTKVFRRTRSSLTLGDLLDVNLKHHMPDSMENIVVQWDGTNFLKVGIESCGEKGCSMIESAPEIIPLNEGEWFGLHSEGLGNIDYVKHGNPTNDTMVPFFIEEPVLPDDPAFATGELILKCPGNNCIRPGLTVLEVAMGDIYYPFGQEVIYTLDPATYTLQTGGVEVTLPDDVSLAGTQFQWGLRTGAMVESSVVLDDPHAIWNEEETISVEFGPNPWNKQMALIDSAGEVVSFEKPLTFYKAVEGYGLMRFEYAGGGEFHGIPFIEDTENFSNGRWHPAFSFANGESFESELGDEYVIRQMEREQVLRSVDASFCSDLSFEGMTLPEDVKIADPGFPAAPTVTDPPLVIGGVLVD